MLVPTRLRVLVNSYLRPLLCLGVLCICSMTSMSTIAEKTIKILPLGDSITHGGKQRPSYRRALWLMLQQHGVSVDFVGSRNDFHRAKPAASMLDFDLDHEGYWGWETAQIVEVLPDRLDSYTPDIALIHLGTNDFDRGVPINRTLDDLSSILAVLRQDNPEITILLAEIIPMRFKSTRQFNDALRKWASVQSTPRSKLVLVDQYTGYYWLIDSYDKYHPNARGEQKIASRWFDALIAILGTK